MGSVLQDVQEINALSELLGKVSFSLQLEVVGPVVIPTKSVKATVRLLRGGHSFDIPVDYTTATVQQGENIHITFPVKITLE